MNGLKHFSKKRNICFFWRPMELDIVLFDVAEHFLLFFS